MTEHAPVTGIVADPVPLAPVSQAAGAGDHCPAQPPQSAQPARPAEAPRPDRGPDRGHGHIASHQQPRSWKKAHAPKPGSKPGIGPSTRPDARPAARAQRRAEPPETQPVEELLRSVPAHYSWHRLSGVVATLERISQLKRLTVDPQATIPSGRGADRAAP